MQRARHTLAAGCPPVAAVYPTALTARNACLDGAAAAAESSCLGRQQAGGPSHEAGRGEHCRAWAGAAGSAQRRLGFHHRWKGCASPSPKHPGASRGFACAGSRGWQLPGARRPSSARPSQTLSSPCQLDAHDPRTMCTPTAAAASRPIIPSCRRSLASLSRLCSSAAPCRQAGGGGVGDGGGEEAAPSYGTGKRGC